LVVVLHVEGVAEGATVNRASEITEAFQFAEILATLPIVNAG